MKGYTHMNKIHPYERKVYYYETDKMSVMHHSNYIRIFEETRVSYLQQAGMPFEDIEAKGLMMPVLSVECRYKRPLVFDEPFAVYAKIVKFNGATLHMEYRIISRKSHSAGPVGDLTTNMNLWIIKDFHQILMDQFFKD